MITAASKTLYMLTAASARARLAFRGLRLSKYHGGVLRSGRKRTGKPCLIQGVGDPMGLAPTGAALGRGLFRAGVPVAAGRRRRCDAVLRLCTTPCSCDYAKLPNINGLGEGWYPLPQRAPISPRATCAAAPKVTRSGMRGAWRLHWRHTRARRCRV